MTYADGNLPPVGQSAQGGYHNLVRDRAPGWASRSGRNNPRAILPAMASTAELLTWVREGERLFGAVIGVLQQHEPLRAKVSMLEQENQQLREDLQAARAELEFFRAERVEAAETLKAIAEHVTRLATVALQRLGRPVA